MGPYYILSNFGDEPRPNSTNNLFHEILFNSWKQKLFMFSILKSTQFWPQMFQIKFIFLMIFYEDNGQNLKTMLHFIQTEKKSHRQFDDEKYFGVCPILQ